jgi:hypothetical protein
MRMVPMQENVEVTERNIFNKVPQVIRIKQEIITMLNVAHLF